MASKYEMVRKLMELQGFGSMQHNDCSTQTGVRILKWDSRTIGASLEQRKKEAAEVMECFAGMHPFANGTFDYVQKVVVKLAKAYNGHGDECATRDKVCVYVDTNKMK